MSIITNGTPIKATGTGTTSATATVTGVANTQYIITDISASSDKEDSIILVKDGSTTIWQDIVGATSYQHQLASPLRCSVGNDAIVTIDGTLASKANLAGVSISVA
jgi:hypothetical protein